MMAMSAIEPDVIHISRRSERTRCRLAARVRMADGFDPASGSVIQAPKNLAQRHLGQVFLLLLLAAEGGDGYMHSPTAR